jgi:hypothetical protein
MSPIEPAIIEALIEIIDEEEISDEEIEERILAHGKDTTRQDARDSGRGVKAPARSMARG